MEYLGGGYVWDELEKTLEYVPTSLRERFDKWIEEVTDFVEEENVRIYEALKDGLQGEQFSDFVLDTPTEKLLQGIISGSKQAEFAFGSASKGEEFFVNKMREVLPRDFPVRSQKGLVKYLASRGVLGLFLKIVDNGFSGSGGDCSVCYRLSEWYFTQDPHRAIEYEMYVLKRLYGDVSKREG
jgi:hypothetical protein